MEISDEIYEKMAKIDNFLYCAVYGHYASGLNSEHVEYITALWNQIFDSKPKKRPSTCGRCNLTILQDLGKLYFPEKKRREEKPTEKLVKRGRKRKENK